MFSLFFFFKLNCNLSVLFDYEMRRGGVRGAGIIGLSVALKAGKDAGDLDFNGFGNVVEFRKEPVQELDLFRKLLYTSFQSLLIC